MSSAEERCKAFAEGWYLNLLQARVVYTSGGGSPLRLGDELHADFNDGGGKVTKMSELIRNSAASIIKNSEAVLDVMSRYYAQSDKLELYLNKEDTIGYINKKDRDTLGKVFDDVFDHCGIFPDDYYSFQLDLFALLSDK